VIEGDKVAIKIPKDEYQFSLGEWKHNLHGRMVWPKAATPLEVGALKAKLTPQWGLLL